MLPKRREKGKAETPSGTPGGVSAEAKEELALLRQQASSLALRGHYKECFKLVEDNLAKLYIRDRWPENFYASLKLHRRCYPSMNIDAPYEEYLTALLRKRGIPWVFALFFKAADSSVVWSADYFKDLAIISEGQGNFDAALGYAELAAKIDPLSSNLYLLKGWILDDLERHDDAAAQYEQALTLHEKNFQAHQGLCKYYLRKKDFDKALHHITAALELMPNEASCHALRADLLLRKGEKQEALACYEEAAILDPTNPEYPYLKGELLLRDKQEPAALRQYSKAVGLNEKHLPSLRRLTELLKDTQPETALLYVNTITTLEPQNSEAALLRAHLHEKVGDTFSAIRQYKKALDIHEDNAQALGALGFLYIPLSKETALEYLSKAAELEPNNASYHFGKAQALQGLERPGEAILEYKAAISLNKNMPKAYAELGYLYGQANPKEAISCFNRAIALDPENPYYYASKAEMLLLLPHKPEEAIACFDEAVQRDPGNAALQLRLATFLEKVGNHASAVEHYRAAASLDQSLREAYYSLARLLCDSEPGMALLYINSAIDLDADNGDYYYTKARILLGLGLHMDALEHLKRSSMLDSGNDQIMQEISRLLGGDSLRLSLLYMNRAIELQSNNSAYICARANILYSLKQMPQALEQYEAAYKLDQSNHEAIFGAARILAGKKDQYKAALEYYDKAIALAPATAAYPAHKAQLLAQQHETYLEALACYDKAIALDKRNWEVILQKAELLYQNGDLLSAQEDFRRCLLANPHCLEANVRMCALLADTKPVAALAYIDHALTIDDKVPLHHMWRGQLLYTLGNEREAQEAFGKAVALGQSGGEVHYLLAQVLEGRLPETALKHCRIAVELSPDMAEAHLLLGDLYFFFQEAQQALACYERALALTAKCHRALAGIVRVRFERRPTLENGARIPPGEDCFILLDEALALDAGNVEYLVLKARMLEALNPPRLAEAIDVLSHAVKSAPERLHYRETLVALLQRNRSYARYILEKAVLNSLRKKLFRRERALARMEDSIPSMPVEQNA